MTDDGSWSDLDDPIRRILKQCRHSFYLAFGITGIVEILSLAPIVYMWNVFDRVISPRSGITLLSLTVMVIAIYLFWALLERLRDALFVQLAAKLDWDLSSSVFDASFRRYVGYSNVNLHQLLSELLMLRQALTGRPILALMDAPFALVFIAVGFVFHPILALFVVVATALILITSFASQKLATPLLKAANEENALATKLAADSLRQAEVTMAMGMLPAVRRRWFARHQKFLQLQINASDAAGSMRGVSGVVSMSMPSLQIAVGAWLAIEGAITGGMVIAASMLIGKAISPLSRLIAERDSIISARQAYDRLNVLLAADQVHSNKMSLPAPTGNLVVNGLVLVPPASTNVVLNGLAFSLKPGELLAVIGPSAAGKTCLARALVGVWRPYQGSVRLDGVEVSDWAHEELGQSLGYVPQEVDFFDGTIAENIARLGEVDAEKVVAAARMVGFHETILKLPDGYDTRIGPEGFALSGGQKQSLALARACYNSPRFIVLDEPNSNLDDAAEQAFKKSLAALKKSKAAIVVMTHDPRIARLADLLLVIREGRQIGFGTSAEMLDALKPRSGAAANKLTSPQPESIEPETPANPDPDAGPVAQANGHEDSKGSETPAIAEGEGAAQSQTQGKAAVISVVIGPPKPIGPRTPPQGEQGPGKAVQDA